ncbi:MAG: hypothetical protein E7Z62_02125 [Thermoplasmata archaeon]|nr:hypothetical protein [Thermoplasmata archaeon]
MNYEKAALAVSIVAIMLFSGLPLTEADGDGAGNDQIYGATTGIDLSEIDEILKLITGKTLKELVEDLAKTMDYDVTFDPELESKFAMTRDIHDEDGHRTIVDRLSGYFTLSVDLVAEGKFPAAGTYLINDGESAEDFLKRVFIDGSTEDHKISNEVVLGMTLDLALMTDINTETGEMEDAYIAFFPMLYTELDGDMKIADLTDDDDNLVGITIDYEKYHSLSNVYGDFQITLDIDDLKVLGDGEWTCNPMITEHVERSVVSSDLVNDLWPLIKKVIGEGGKISKAIPELILNILTSTDRKLDIFDTIKSLTGKTVHDITFTGDVTVSNETDELGNPYVLFKVKRNDTTVDISYPLEGYSFEAGKIIDLIPDSLISKEAKGIIKAALIIIGLGHVEMPDITDDQKKQEECSTIQNAVNEIIIMNEEYETDIPLVFIVLAVIIVIAACAATFLMWRGKI